MQFKLMYLLNIAFILMEIVIIIIMFLPKGRALVMEGRYDCEVSLHCLLTWELWTGY